jgi:hypothetical protein
MDTDPATTPGNNTEDALVESSPIGAQAAPDDDDVQIEHCTRSTYCARNAQLSTRTQIKE